jgi:hypothetical protein
VQVHRIVIASALAAGALAVGCASGIGDTYVWKRPCGTDAQREADRQACLTESAGVVDPSGNPGVEYAQDLFRECMEARGWQRVPAGTVLKCE